MPGLRSILAVMVVAQMTCLSGWAAAQRPEYVTLEGRVWIQNVGAVSDGWKVLLGPPEGDVILGSTLTSGAGGPREGYYRFTVPLGATVMVWAVSPDSNLVASPRRVVVARSLGLIHLNASLAAPASPGKFAEFAILQKVLGIQANMETARDAWRARPPEVSECGTLVSDAQRALRSTTTSIEQSALRNRILLLQMIASCVADGSMSDATTTTTTTTTGQGWLRFSLTSASYRETDELARAVEKELGHAAVIADWTELPSSARELESLLDAVGSKEGEMLLITYRGARQASTARYFFLQRGVPHPGAGVYARVGNVAWVGSWHGYSNLRILATLRDLGRQRR